MNASVYYYKCQDNKIKDFAMESLSGLMFYLGAERVFVEYEIIEYFY